MIRVVLDTNVVISALYRPESVPAQVISLARRGQVQNYTSDAILDEIEGVLVKKFQWSALRARDARECLSALSIRVVPKEEVSVLPYFPDNQILATALEARASFLITGDKKHLLPLGKFLFIEIIEPWAFLRKFTLPPRS